MTHYTIFDTTTGEDISVGTSEPTLKVGQSFRATAYDPNRHADRTKRYVWNTETRDYDETDSRRGILSPAEFMQRFTVQERIAIRGERGTDPVVHDFLSLLEVAQNVDLDDPATVAGVGYLVSVNLLTAERATLVRAWT